MNSFGKYHWMTAVGQDPSCPLQESWQAGSLLSASSWVEEEGAEPCRGGGEWSRVLWRKSGGGGFSEGLAPASLSNKSSQSAWLQRHLFSHTLKARSPKSRCWSCCAPCKALGEGPSFFNLLVASSNSRGILAPICISVSSFLQRIPVIGLAPRPNPV